MKMSFEHNSYLKKLVHEVKKIQSQQLALQFSLLHMGAAIHSMMQMNKKILQ